MKVERSGNLFDLDTFLARPLMAHLATASPDGPRESPVWFLWEDGAVWLVGTSSDSFPRRIRDDSRCAIGFVEFVLEQGLLLHVGMRGTATIERLDDARLHRLLCRYLGDEKKWNRAFVQTVIDELDLMVRFTPESVVMRDQSYFL
jgi:Pyridoxamine 5'-phosphate oxidase